MDDSEATLNSEKDSGSSKNDPGAGLEGESSKMNLRGSKQNDIGNLQNHVDKDSKEVKLENSQGNKKMDSSKDPIENSDDESQTDNKDDVQKEHDNTDDDSQMSKTVDDETNKSTADGDDSKTDDIENPQFENAPNLPDEPQDDHTQALDPFDVLLKGPETADASTSSSRANINDDEDEDDHNTEEASTEEANLDDSGSTDLVEEPGADEEVCLLPDTERELSEADKAEAEKALALKRQQAEDSLVAKKEEPETKEEDTKETSTDDVEEGTSQENGAEKEVAGEVTVEVGDTLEEKIKINQIDPITGTCIHCNTKTSCSFLFTKDNEASLICTQACLNVFISICGENYKLETNKYTIEEIRPAYLTCSECEEKKTCYFYYKYDGEDTNYCSLECLESMMADEKDKYVFKRRVITINEIAGREETCFRCELIKPCTMIFERYGKKHHVCSIACVKLMQEKEKHRYQLKFKRNKPVAENPPLLKLKVMSNATDKYLGEAYKIQTKTPGMIKAAREDREKSFVRSCMQCSKETILDDKHLIWETMDFCNEICLASYQNKIGSKCAKCKKVVSSPSLGKYCVRFGYDIRQFCNSSCLDEFKKGLKICCFCQKDISSGQGFLAPVGDKRQFKDFCSPSCMERFDQIQKNSSTLQPQWAKCAVCSLEKMTTIEIEVGQGINQRLCSEPCFAAFKFVNTINPDQCKWCKKYFERKTSNCHTIYDGTAPYCFCSKSCINIYISTSRHIVPCNWCKVKKYNYDMVNKKTTNGQNIMMCSLNCLNLYQVSVNVFSSRRIKCDLCSRSSSAQYHLTMSDATVRNFCTYQCVMKFQSQYSHSTLVQGKEQSAAPKPTGAPRRTYMGKNNATLNKPTKGMQRASLPVISNVQSLASTPPPLMQSPRVRTKTKIHSIPVPEPEIPPAPKTPPPPPKPVTPPPPPPPKIFNHVLVKTLPPVQVSNKATLTKPMMVSRGVSCRPHPCTKECQTDSSLERRILIPVPVPIYVPVPCAMYSLPFPVPVPIPIPIPTPVFIPTTRNSAKGIMKEINKIHDKMPTDPFEAELLMMAELVAGDKKKDQSDSDTDEDNGPDDGFSPVAMDGNNTFGEDMLQMALKMATEYEEPAVDLESAMTASTITPSSHPGMPGLEGEAMHHHHHMMVLEQQRAVAALRASTAPRKRTPAPPARPARGKRRRPESTPAPPEPPREPAEKPDANMCLKYTFGVNAWKQWVMTKNAEIEKSSLKKRPFKSEILQLTADELNYSLCLFVKEVRKPNGSEYAPDTIYYLVLGIQQYLFENSRIDNIFTDPYYEKFTDCLDEVAKKFSILYNDSQYIVTRVEEEHLWESKQLGAHSPHVLLSTLMFFNTKHFNLVTVEEHMQLSFSHIMKHWKRNPNQPGQAKLPGSRNVLLRFYPPQSALEANSRKKKVYEQQENEENPLRCPVKLYEFYISKCPESVRTRNDVFYLQPERSCVPDSPVWYSTQPLSRDALSKMLHRVKMVKEINIALLTS